LNEAIINRLSRQTRFSYSQIKAYIDRVLAISPTTTDAGLEYCIREADQYEIDIDILGR
jgi:hypothetical protein